MKRSLLVLLVCSTIFAGLLSCSTTVVSFKVEPSKHDFGVVNISMSSSFDFILTNKKSVDMTLTTVSFTTGEFSEVTNAMGKTITAKGTLTITVEFAPILPGGAKQDTMHLAWTDINGKTGKKDIKLDGEAVPVPIISVTPSNYDFGTVGLTQTDSHDFVVENTGTADLILSLLNFNGNATLFSITVGGLTPITILPGATHTITVQFAPIAVGTFPTVFEITHNAVNATPPAAINISAAGGGGKLEMNQTSPWDFGTLKTGGSTTDDIELSNNGSIDLDITGLAISSGNAYTIDNCEDCHGNPITTPFSISVGDFVKVTIKFAPTVAGLANGVFTITHNGSYTTSPTDVALLGTGRAPIVQTFNYTGRIANWNVPGGVTSAQIEAWGAQGARAGGRGARMRGDFVLNPGETLKIIAGEKGENGDNTRTWLGGGGGGGSFVCKSNNDPMIIAGGGGGYSSTGSTTTMHGRITTDGGDTYQNGGGNAGNGGRNGVTNGPAAGGGGLLTNGQDASTCQGGRSFLNGGAGGTGTPSNYAGGDGGFGGGGGGYCSGNWFNRSGGGGGYSGGQGGTWSGQYSGGGGGSINNGSNPSNTAGVKTDNGQVQITY